MNREELQIKIGELLPHAKFEEGGQWINIIIESTQTNDDELVGMYSQKEEMEKGLSEAEREYYESRGNIDQVEKELREVQHTRQNIDSLLMELQNSLNERKLQLN